MGSKADAAETAITAFLSPGPTDALYGYLSFRIPLCFLDKIWAKLFERIGIIRDFALDANVIHEFLECLLIH